MSFSRPCSKTAECIDASARKGLTVKDAGSRDAPLEVFPSTTNDVATLGAKLPVSMSTAWLESNDCFTIDAVADEDVDAREISAVARSRPAHEILAAPMPGLTWHSMLTAASPMIRAFMIHTSMCISIDDPNRSAAANDISSMPVPGMMVRPPTAWSQRAGTLDVHTLNSTRPASTFLARKMSL